jgi:hypothetical protein
MRDIRAIMWFDIRKETDWRIKSSKQSAAAFKEIMQDPIFLSSGEELAELTISGGQPEKKKATANKALSPVLIDGDLSEWNKSSPIVMKDIAYFKEGLIWDGPEDLSGMAYLMWDEVNLYLAVEITDNMPLVNKQERQNIWNGDAIEVVLSVNPKADSGRTSFRRGDYQIGFGTGDGKENLPTVWNWQRRRVPTGSEIVVKKIGKPLGYVLEAKVPWAFFRPQFVPSGGKKLPFDIAFDDADSSGERERQFIWNGDHLFYKDPGVWGVLELK